MPVVRLSKVLLAGGLAALAFIIAYDNLVDCNSNYEFVKHVLSMDTTFPDNQLKDRAITNPAVWKAGYAMLIASEGITALLFAIGAVAMLRTAWAPVADFNRAKLWIVVAATIGYGVWFFGFMVVGGEFFAMCQSKTWNGQEAAFRFYMTMLAVLIFVNQPDAEREPA
jgi:predicted small integral membrane protein